MKNFLTKALAALFLFLYIVYFPQGSIHTRADAMPAVGDYACILAEDTFFYSSADERRGLFLLPKSYYVRLLEYGTEYCKVEYQTEADNTKRLTGYTRTDALTFVNYVPKRPYLYYIFDVTYRLDGLESGDSPFLNEITLSCTYYGDYKIGSETYCYVLRGSEFGYILKPDSLSYEENTEYEDYVASLSSAPDSAEPPIAEAPQNSPMQIAILVAVCVLVPVLAALILKPPRRPPYETEEF